MLLLLQYTGIFAAVLDKYLHLVWRDCEMKLCMGGVGALPYLSGLCVVAEYCDWSTFSSMSEFDECRVSDDAAEAL